MSKEKIFVPKSNVKSIETSHGNIIKLGLHVDSFIEFAKQHQTDSGYINIDIFKRKNFKENEPTHYICLNDWSSSQKSRDHKSVSVDVANEVEDESIPF